MKTLITIIVNLLPYYFTEFGWYRLLVYKAYNNFLPISLSMVQYLIDHQDEIEIVDK